MSFFLSDEMGSGYQLFIPYKHREETCVVPQEYLSPVPKVWGFRSENTSVFLEYSVLPSPGLG